MESMGWYRAEGTVMAQVPKVVLDTNILVAAGFNPASSSARIVQAIKDRQVQLVWNEATRNESRRIIEQIPPLKWPAFEALFRRGVEFTGVVDPGRYAMIEDRDDRKFAVLAAAAGAALITNDEHLLSVRHNLGVTVLPTRDGQALGPGYINGSHPMS
jgi:predicted nucleic acid-binding protein